jgi:hypothetical protein
MAEVTSRPAENWQKSVKTNTLQDAPHFVSIMHTRYMYLYKSSNATSSHAASITPSVFTTRTNGNNQHHHHQQHQQHHQQQQQQQHSSSTAAARAEVS